MRITRKMLRDWGACYSDEQIAELVPESGVTPLQVCDTVQIPEEDILWVLLREEIIPARELRLLACKWAASALIAVKVDDIRSWRAVWTAAQYAYGLADDSQLAAARAAARSAAGEAARAAASAAAGEAARAAARAAAGEAARAAARAAAWEAARAAARAAAWKAQLTDVRAVLVQLGAR